MAVDTSEVTTTTNPVDPVLDPANQHHHAHHNHPAFTECDREDTVIYASDPNLEKNVVADPSPLEDVTKGSSSTEDLEQTGESYPKRPWHRRVLKNWLHAVYAVIFLLFTG